MPAYLIAQAKIIDIEKVKPYWAAVPDSVERGGGRYLVRSEPSEILEGDWEPERIVMMEFPDVETASSWYHGEYSEKVKPLREGGADVKIILVDGVTPDPLKS